MDTNEDRFVSFDIYCPLCKHKELKEYHEPCNECLAHPVNKNSEKPIYFEQRRNI